MSSRRLAIIVLLAVTASSVQAQQRTRQVRAAAAEGAVRIYNPAGSVTVTGWDRDSIAVEGSGNGKKLLLHVSGANAKLGYDLDDEASPVQLDVHVPAGSRVWVRTATADVLVRAVRGGVDVNTVSGRIELNGEPAEAYLESMGGRVTAEVGTRVLRVRTAGGDVDVRGRVTDAQVYTVSGLISIMNKEVERGRFESVDGGIQYRGAMGRAGTVEFITHSGDMDVALPKQLDADIHISSFQGKVTNQLGGQTHSVAGNGRERTIVLGRGGAEVVLRTFKGAVRLRPL